MILLYEDEFFWIKDYIEIIEKNYPLIKTDNFDEVLSIYQNKTNDLKLIIIDIMVFSNGIELNKNILTDGYNNGIRLISEIKILEKKDIVLNEVPIIVFTNRKGEVIDKLKSDSRINKVLRKSEVLPSELLEIIDSIIDSEEKL
jgi:hypothetical protein